MTHLEVIKKKDLDQILTKNQKIVFNLLQKSGKVGEYDQKI